MEMVKDIKVLISERKYIITLHARKRMDERGVSSTDLIKYNEWRYNRGIPR